MLTLTLLLCAAAPPVDAEQRALAFLQREVPRWTRDENCYSCHNNADAARALYHAARLGRPVPAAALADTSRWLSNPAGWDNNGGDGPFNDRKLATLQFAATLTTALDTGHLKDRRPLEAAARRVADLQEKDGSWQVLPPGTLGSPITQGPILATHFARTTLRHADERRHADAIRKADDWLRRTGVVSVLDAGSILLALAKDEDKLALAQKRRALDLLRKGEARNGGWGPYVTSQPEAFDTALVLLALSASSPTDETKRWSRSGRAFLLREQESDGGWPATTRPSGNDSYAQRISTSGWATLALLATK